MPETTLSVAPGIVQDNTYAASQGRWIAGDKVRFEDGRAQSIGGWEAFVNGSLNGVARSARAWTCAGQIDRAAFGEHDALEVVVGGQIFDITPSAGFTAGDVDGLAGVGFGTGTYSGGTYGSGSGTASSPMIWALANWGQNLLAAPRRQGLFEWALDTAVVAAAVTGAPTDIQDMFVTPSRFVVLLGTTEEVSGTFNPRLVRWSDQEDNTGWTTVSTGEAGELELQEGSRIVGGIAGTQEHLIWTDTSLFAMRQTFDDLIWGFPLVGRNCGLLGPNAMGQLGGAVYWMGHNGFYRYAGGAPEPIPSELDTEIFSNISPGQEEKCFCAVVDQFNEIWWFYPDERDGNEISRYVIYDVVEGVWSSGTMERTCWTDSAVFSSPIAPDASGNVYLHETGASDNGGLMGASIESGLINIQDGENMVYIRGCMPDVQGQTGGLQLTVFTRETARGAERTFGPYSISSATERVWFEAFGRFARFKVAGASAPEFWRLGDMRFDIVPQGARV